MTPENIDDDELVDQLRGQAKDLPGRGPALMLRAAKRIDDLHAHMDAQEEWTRMVEDKNRRLTARNAHLEKLLVPEDIRR